MLWLSLALPSFAIAAIVVAWLGRLLE